jgi:dTMP kinase
VFVTFEGIDGSGKTTQAALLAEWFAGEGYEAVLLREPGGTPLGERLRALLLDGAGMSAWAEAALFAAARAELVEREIRPALGRGAAVVCDRFVDSSLAYQGVGRGLGIDAVLELNEIATGGLMPDRTFVLLLDPDDSAARRAGEPDRMEREDGLFVAALDAGYRRLVSMFPERCLPLDAARPVDELAEEVRGRLAGSGAGAARGEAPA